MKKKFAATGFFAIVLVSVVSFVFGGRYFQQGYILEHERDLAKEQPSPHKGIGMSTAYSLFAKAPELKLTFRKRVLKKGSSIGYHLQNEDEIYYIASGTGIMRMNNDSFAVKAGDGILTRPGNSHGLQQTGDEELVVIINYLTK
jgi:mannose-6-phosphate isomerase-like protein (cupin superfamily)